MSSELTASVHIATLMAVFAKPTLNFAWNTALGSQEMIMVDGQQVALQQYKLPWPLSNREFILKCSNSPEPREQKFVSRCSSVSAEDLPVKPGSVRGELRHSRWVFTALPGDRTHIFFESWVDPRGDVPKPVVRAAQHFGKDTLTKALVAVSKKLDLPRYEALAQWDGMPASRTPAAVARQGVRIDPAGAALRAASAAAAGMGSAVRSSCRAIVSARHLLPRSSWMQYRRQPENFVFGEDAEWVEAVQTERIDVGVGTWLVMAALLLACLAAIFVAIAIRSGSANVAGYVYPSAPREEHKWWCSRGHLPSPLRALRLRARISRLRRSRSLGSMSMLASSSETSRTFETELIFDASAALFSGGSRGMRKCVSTACIGA